jgi:hypothetical protein
MFGTRSSALLICFSLTTTAGLTAPVYAGDDVPAPPTQPVLQCEFVDGLHCSAQPTGLANSVPPPAAAPTFNNSESAKKTAEGLEQATSVVDTTMTGVMLTGQAAATAVQDADALKALGSSESVIGGVTKGASAAAQLYNGYQQEGQSGLYRAEAQVITNQVAENAIVNGSAAVGGTFFGPPGAEAGELVGKGSVFVGGLIKQLPCGNTNVDGCVTDWEHDAVNSLVPGFDCKVMGVCINQPSVAPPSASASNGSDDDTSPDASASRTQMEGEFADVDAQNTAAAQQAAADQAAQAQAAQDGSPDSGSADMLAAIMLGITQGLATLPARATPNSSAPLPPAAAGPPPGWVECTCPAQHAGLGRYLNGALWHPEGPQCK